MFTTFLTLFYHVFDVVFAMFDDFRFRFFRIFRQLFSHSLTNCLRFLYTCFDVVLLCLTMFYYMMFDDFLQHVIMLFDVFYNLFDDVYHTKRSFTMCFDMC
jgi:hypothetical protein